MVVTSSLQGTKRKVSLVSNSSTFAHVCMFCNKRYLTERGLNHHLQRYCKHATDHRNRKQEHLGTILQHNIEDDPSIREDINSSTNSNSFCFGIEPAEDSLISSVINNPRPSSIRRPNNEEEHIDQHHGEESASTLLASSNSNELAIYNQECKFLESNVGVQNVWRINDLAKIDLLQTLNRHGCPNKLYDDILKWTRHYNSRSGLTLFDNGTQFERRETFLRLLSKKQDMKKLETQINLLVFNNGGLINITTFDFKQQLLSMFRDKKLMSPENIIYDQEPPADNNNISEIQDSTWYKNAIQYFNNKYGIDKDRMVCGIILSIDKTHTDSKGNLCLEPVNFSLSIS